jgi:hypothetical protein
MNTKLQLNEGRRRALLIWAQSHNLGVEKSIVRAVMFTPILSTRANKTPTRADERKARGKGCLCLVGLLEL